VRDRAVHGLIGAYLGQVPTRLVHQFVDFGRGRRVDDQSPCQMLRADLGQVVRVRAAIPGRFGPSGAKYHRWRPLGLQVANYFGKVTAQGRSCMRALATRGEPPEAHGGASTPGGVPDWESVRLFIEVVRRGSARCVEDLPTSNGN